MPELRYPPEPSWVCDIPYCTRDEMPRCRYWDGKRCEIQGHQPDQICKPAVEAMATKLKQQPPIMVTDRDMNRQMFVTMQALEGAAKAVVDHLTADKRPTMCPSCQSMAEDSAQRNEQVSARVCACNDPLMKGPHRTQGTCGCPSCDGGIDEAECLCDVDRIFDGNVVVKGDLRVEGCTTTVESDVEMLKLREADVSDIQAQLKAHRQALAIIARFGAFGDSGFGLLDPQEEVARKIGSKSCDCVGTGWVARDETCKECKGKGYVTP